MVDCVSAVGVGTLRCSTYCGGGEGGGDEGGGGEGGGDEGGGGGGGGGGGSGAVAVARWQWRRGLQAGKNETSRKRAASTRTA